MHTSRRTTHLATALVITATVLAAHVWAADCPELEGRWPYGSATAVAVSGDYAFVGGKSAVVKDVPPYVIAAGDRAVLHGLNRVGLKRHGFSNQALSALKKTYRIMFRYGLTLNEAIERVHAEVEMVPEVETFIGFIKASSRGVTR